VSEEDLGRAVGRLLRLGASRKVHARQVAAAGVTISPPGHLLLQRIVEEGPLALGQLSARTEMDPGATSRQVRALEEEGLVERRTSAGDGRVSLVEATAEGRQVRRRMADVQSRHMADVLEGWEDRDRDELARLLTRFVDDLRSVQYRPADLRSINRSA
jgi:DNA-binding MarR family transcriptional regulator